MDKAFKGFHGEWNLGSPGGWEYQKMLQEIYLPIWQKLKTLAGLDLELDFEDELLKPSHRLADSLIESSRKIFPEKKPFIVIMAEEEALDEVVENIRFTEYLNSLPNIKAKYAGPREIKSEGEKIIVGGEEATCIFMDFNTTVLAQLEEKHAIDAILKAIQKGLVVNPRSMECINTKSIFEIVDDLKSRLSPATIQYTPWTRRFFKRETTGPNGEKIENLVEWTRENWEKVILKPALGWSGKGIIVCPNDNNKDAGIEKALTDKTYGEYIVQEFVPLRLWTEAMPEIDKEQKMIVLNNRQTDFRCLISHKGLMGFLGRYGGIPTNVGSGGGVQALAIIKSQHSPKRATEMLNQAFLKIDFAEVKKLRQSIDDMAMDMNFVYLNGPIPIALRPRVVSEEQIGALKNYAENLYQDTLLLEQMWFDGKLDDIVNLSPKEKAIAKLFKRKNDTPAMMAADGLFSFTE